VRSYTISFALEWLVDADKKIKHNTRTPKISDSTSKSQEKARLSKGTPTSFGVSFKT
jgi:hypothetical protein